MNGREESMTSASRPKSSTAKPATSRAAKSAPNVDTTDVVRALVDRVHAAIAKMNLPAALMTTDIEAYTSYFSIIARRSGTKLTLHAAQDPTTFASMAHARPQLDVSLGRLAAGIEVQVLRDAANTLALPEGARAIPFTLVTSSGKTHVQRTCGVAFSPALHAEVVLRAHGDGPLAPVQALVIGAEEIAAVELGQYDQRFGTVVLRRPLAEVASVDIDERMIAVELSDGRRSWSLIDAPADAIEHVRSTARGRGIRTRRLVQVDPSTREWADD
jgi:hypothetical protein